MSEDQPKIDKPDSPKPKHSVGRPPLDFPQPIDAEPADVAKAAFKLNPNKPGFEWQYLKESGKPQRRK